MEETITISKTELQELIAKEVAKIQMQSDHRTLTVQNLYSDIKFSEERDIRPINILYPQIIDLLTENGKRPLNGKYIFSNGSHYHGYDEPCGHYGFYGNQVHDNIRKLTNNLFGKSKNSELTRDEYEMARHFYSEIANLFNKSYAERLAELSKHIKKATTPASK